MQEAKPLLTDTSGSCKVKRTNRNFNTDTVKHVRRDISDDEDLHI